MPSPVEEGETKHPESMRPMTTTRFRAGQSVSWVFGICRRLVPATVLRDDGAECVHLRVLRSDGQCEHRKVPRDHIVNVGQGDLFDSTASAP